MHQIKFSNAHQPFLIYTLLRLCFSCDGVQCSCLCSLRTYQKYPRVFITFALNQILETANLTWLMAMKTYNPRLMN